MDERDGEDALRRLQQRLDQARGADQGTRPQAGGDGGDAQNAFGIACRIGLGLVVAVFVGAALGWACDRWLGTEPWGLIVFLFLGFGGGVANVFRVALGSQRAVGLAPRQTEAPKPPNAWDDDED